MLDLQQSISSLWDFRGDLCFLFILEDNCYEIRKSNYCCVIFFWSLCLDYFWEEPLAPAHIEILCQLSWLYGHILFGFLQYMFIYGILSLFPLRIYLFLDLSFMILVSIRYKSLANIINSASFSILFFSGTCIWYCVTFVKIVAFLFLLCNF